MPSYAVVVFDGPASPAHTLSPLRRGPGDPCYQRVDGAIQKLPECIGPALQQKIGRIQVFRQRDDSQIDL